MEIAMQNMKTKKTSRLKKTWKTTTLLSKKITKPLIFPFLYNAITFKNLKLSNGLSRALKLYDDAFNIKDYQRLFSNGKSKVTQIFGLKGLLKLNKLEIINKDSKEIINGIEEELRKMPIIKQNISGIIYTLMGNVRNEFDRSYEKEIINNVKLNLDNQPNNCFKKEIIDLIDNELNKQITSNEYKKKIVDILKRGNSITPKILDNFKEFWNKNNSKFSYNDLKELACSNNGFVQGAARETITENFSHSPNASVYVEQPNSRLLYAQPVLLSDGESSITFTKRKQTLKPTSWLIYDPKKELSNEDIWDSRKSKMVNGKQMKSYTSTRAYVARELKISNKMHKDLFHWLYNEKKAEVINAFLSRPDKKILKMSKAYVSDLMKYNKVFAKEYKRLANEGSLPQINVRKKLSKSNKTAKQITTVPKTPDFDYPQI